MCLFVLVCLFACLVLLCTFFPVHKIQKTKQTKKRLKSCNAGSCSTSSCTIAPQSRLFITVCLPFPPLIV